MGLFGKTNGDDELRPDIAAAEARMGSHIGIGKAIRRLAALLNPDETVLEMAFCPAKPVNAVLVVTNQRVIIQGDSLGNKVQAAFSLAQINAVGMETQWGPTNGKIIIESMGKTEAFTVHKKETQRIKDAIDKARAAAVVPPTASPTSRTSASIPEQISQLAGLREQGVLSSDEFEAKKAELLARM